ncbi:MAG: Uma2 family endonuclease [Gammaproteobacteria bacterium]|nr:Uma2 family endonuclease [Gammaproteobacteria bacterium]
MTAAPHGMDKLANGGVVVRLQPALCPTDEQFFQFCRLNDEWRIERDSGGEVSIMPPAGWETGAMNAEITFQLQRWARTDGTGRAADSSAGYLLPNGAVRSPDASWVSNGRLAGVTTEQQSRFLPACPDFVAELRSPTDSIAALKNKMGEYMACGTTLAWLIDPANRKVWVYRQGSDIEELDSPTSISGNPPLKGFRLKLGDIWDRR